MVARIEGAFADELKQIAMNLICARFGYGIDYRIRVEPVSRGGAVGLDAELLKRVGEGERQVHVGMRIVMIAAVE